MQGVEKILKIQTEGVLKQKNGRLIMQSTCNECGFKQSRFIKE